MRKNIIVAQIAGILISGGMTMNGASAEILPTVLTNSSQTQIAANVEQVHHRKWRGHRISERRAVRIAKRMGFRKILAVRDKGDVYVVRAKAPHRYRARIVINAFNGQVIAVRPIHKRPNYGWYGHWH
ncbi:hypothetical protein E1162_04675 [Rhodobacteraceae bacterium RKSG542]|uniref:PepSY domain-containing protein n=1 Tax=Pseudovibrio flavus TaxID=2529854 RepID=UPI0012BB922F|nr:PepSY domain-containing protein [Pseudovibrio flavus]MTI16532.1 hypothetical protein [Pseudovibrio flavus]